MQLRNEFSSALRDSVIMTPGMYLRSGIPVALRDFDLKSLYLYPPFRSF